MTSLEWTTPALAIASNNPGKIEELRRLLGSGVRIVTLAELDLESPEETGDTFAANAMLKARHVHDVTGLPALADDSGLEVDALDGAPGVRSARFAGDESDDAANRARLLEVLEGVGAEARSARFVCAIAIVHANGDVNLSYGKCEGNIALTERGSGGFGYDSLFELPEGRTMAELSPGEKNRISHRATAMRLALPYLREALVRPNRDGESGPA